METTKDQTWNDHMQTGQILEDVTIGDYRIVLVKVVEQSSFIHYHYRLIAFPKGRSDPVLSLNLESNPAAGTCCLGAHLPEGHDNLGFADEGMGQEAFRTWAFDMANRYLGLAHSPPPEPEAKIRISNEAEESAGDLFTLTARNLENKLLIESPELGSATNHEQPKHQSAIEETHRKPFDMTSSWNQIKPLNDEHSQIDKKLARLYVQHVIAIGEITCSSISKALKSLLDDSIILPVNNYTIFKTSFALLGASLAVLVGNPQKITTKRAEKIAILCRSSLVEDYEDYSDGLEKPAREYVLRYQDIFENALVAEKNPIGFIAGDLLEQCLGSKAESLFLPNSIMNPLILDVVSDLLLLNMTEALTFWRDNPSIINSYDEDGYTPLMRAVQAMNVELATQLIQHGADPKIEDGNFGTSTALDMARLLRKRSKKKDEKKALKKIIALLEHIR